MPKLNQAVREYRNRKALTDMDDSREISVHCDRQLPLLPSFNFAERDQMFKGISMPTLPAVSAHDEHLSAIEIHCLLRNLRATGIPFAPCSVASCLSMAWAVFSCWVSLCSYAADVFSGTHSRIMRGARILGS